ncbi:hypothetical protein RCCGE510_29136 (plasmid) [Rhizobium sp. CCGE 510]|nr:hypothetical protein RCCGE510_29136 [Rhizobium sp. CCGE 510]
MFQPRVALRRKSGVLRQKPRNKTRNHDTAQARAQTYVRQDAAMLKTDTRQANWRRANPGKYDAHLAVQRAVKAGELEKQTCEVCGVEAVDAHHDQYDEPLRVRWLCRRHHTRLHHYGEDMFPIRNAL